MSQSVSWPDRLVQAAKERCIQLPHIDEELVEDERSTEISSWVDRYLQSDKLLTSEELEIWQVIEKKKSPSQGSNTFNNHVSYLLSEEDLRESIRNLELSTQKFNDRSHTLQTQLAHVNTSTSRENGSSAGEASSDTKMSRNRDIEKQQLFFMNEEVDTQIDELLRVTRERVEKISKAVPSTIREKLRVDDRSLEDLEQSLSLISSKKSATTLDCQPMLSALQGATISSLKTRLDRIYLLELDAQDIPKLDVTELDRLQQTQDDLHSLYTEINDVASMLVESQHGTKLRALEHQLKNQAGEDEVRGALQITNKLSDLTSATEQLATRYRLLREHSLMLHEINRYHQQSKQQGNTRALSDSQRHPQNNSEELQALLRHLNIQHESATDGAISTFKQLQASSAALIQDNGQVLEDVVEKSQASSAQSLTRGQALSSSNDDLADAVQKIHSLDSRMTSTKARLETIASTPENNAQGR